MQSKAAVKPVNKVLLCLDRALNDEIITEGGLKLYLDPTWDVHWNATVTGVVKGIPAHSNLNLKIDDVVAFSYRVIADRACNKKDYFQPIFAPLPHLKRFMNGNGDKITFMAIPGVISKIYVCTLVDKRNDLVDGLQGDEHDAERWLAQFNFSNVQDMRFNNLFDINGKDYWSSDIEDIFAKKVKGQIVSIGDRVICEPIDVDVKDRIELLNGIVLPQKSVKIRYYDRAKVVAGGERLGIKKGDIISFDEEFVEKYEFWGKKYFLIKERRVNAIW